MAISRRFRLWAGRRARRNAGSVGANGNGSVAIGGDTNAPIFTTVIHYVLKLRMGWLGWVGGFAAMAAFLPVAWGAVPDPENSKAPAEQPAYAEYELVSDDTGKLSVEVPAEWNSRLSNGWHPWMSPYKRDVKVGPGLNAALNTSDWFDEESLIPGMFVGASSMMAADGITLNRLASVFAPAGCRAEEGPYGIPRLKLTGVLRNWTCRNGTGWNELTLASPDDSYFLCLQVKMVGRRDHEAFAHIVQTLRLDGVP